jgi:hypothetical protein
MAQLPWRAMIVEPPEHPRTNWVVEKSQADIAEHAEGATQ